MAGRIELLPARLRSLITSQPNANHAIQPTDSPRPGTRRRSKQITRLRITGSAWGLPRQQWHPAQSEPWRATSPRAACWPNERSYWRCTPEYTTATCLLSRN